MNFIIGDRVISKSTKCIGRITAIDADVFTVQWNKDDITQVSSSEIIWTNKDYTERLETSLVKAVELPEPKENIEVMETYGEAKGKIDDREAAKQVSIDMKDVESSNIRSMGYNSEVKQLRVVFTNGGIFQYKEIPKEVYEEMMASKSIGSFFSKNIRNNYVCVKLN